MKERIFYLLVLAFVAGMLWVSGQYFKGSRYQSIGIATAKAYKLNSEKSAQVQRISVVPGQAVKAGDLLVELGSPSLEMDIAKLRNRIAILTSERLEKGKLAQSEIAYARAEKAIDIGEIEQEILEISHERHLNISLLSSGRGLSDSLGNALATDPNVASLQSQKSKHEQALVIREREILAKNQIEQRLLENQISLLEQDLALLLEEKNRLRQFASADGVVEDVYVKQGEQVAAYTPLVSLLPTRPTTVTAYLVGKHQALMIGQAVTIRSYERAQVATQGRVIGLGAVVQLPDILQKSTATQAFGQEVFLEVEPTHALAVGEKVLVN